jgi:hypothetical protein
LPTQIRIQLAGDIMAFGQRVQGLAGNKLFGDLPLERRAVGPVPGHGFHPPEAQQGWSIQIA